MKRSIQLMAILLGLLLCMPVLAAKDDNKGHGAGGLRGEHASEQGLEQGKAWAGSKEAPANGQAGTDEEKGGKPDKEKKDKKEKKGKKEK